MGQARAMDFGFNPWQMGGMAGGLMGAGLGSMFSNWQNPADSARPYLDQIPNTLRQYFDPYIQAGQRQLPGLEHEYNGLMQNPGQRMNDIGKSFQQSPGFNFALQQALMGGNQAAAAGGMAGSPMHQQQNMELATNLANQDYNHWLQNALGLYGTGLQGGQHMYDTGAQAGMGLGENLSSALAHRAQMEYEGRNAQNQHESGGWGAFLGGLGSLAGTIPFMP